MHPKSPTTATPFDSQLSDSLTPHEIVILCRRFGIEPDEISEAELEALALVKPPGEGSGGQGGAPVHAVTDANDVEKEQSKVPGRNKTRS